MERYQHSYPETPEMWMCITRTPVASTFRACRSEQTPDPDPQTPIGSGWLTS